MVGSQVQKRIVFMGSPGFAVPSLKALHAAGHEIVAVYSQPPRPAGRGQKLTRTAVHELADELGLPVYTPERLRGEALDEVLAIEADVFCVVAYGLLLPKVLVDSRVCLNVHPSALPRWRGAAPLQWTLMSGDTETEVCVMQLDAGMDTGPVVAREALGVPREWTCGQLQVVTAEMGARMLVEVVADLAHMQPVAQVGEASHAEKISKEMRAVNWARTAEEIHNHVRGISPLPAATSELYGEGFKILETEVVDFDTSTNVYIVEEGKPMREHPAYEPGSVRRFDEKGVVINCGNGSVRIVRMQRAGGKAGASVEILRGWDAFDGEAVLG